MILRRILKRFISQDWIILLSEIFIVIAGIFIAFQVDRWWANRISNNQKQQYLLRLTDDIKLDLESIRRAKELAEFRRGLVDLLIAVAKDPDYLEKRYVEFIVAVDQAAFTHTTVLTSGTFEELQSTGNLNLLTDPDLKAALFEYYRFDESERQYLQLQLMIEFKHFELSSGILSNEQFRYVQDSINVAGPADLARLETMHYNSPKALNAVQRFRDNKELIAWLPQIRSMQLDLIWAHEERRKRAEALLNILNGQ